MLIVSQQQTFSLPLYTASWCSLLYLHFWQDTKEKICEAKKVQVEEPGPFLPRGSWFSTGEEGLPVDSWAEFVF